ncbi:MAG: response regulator [Planctomycetota bacterium]
MNRESLERPPRASLRRGAIYGFNAVAIPLGSLLGLIVAPTVLLIFNYPLGASLAGLSLANSLFMFCLWWFVLPYVRTAPQLDTTAASYFLVAFLTVAISAVWLRDQHALPYVCLLMAGSPAFCSSLVYALTMVIGMIAAIYCQLSAGLELPQNSFFYLFFIAPGVAAILRFSLVRSLRELELSRARSEESMGQLTASREKLRSVQADRARQAQVNHSQKMESLGLLARGIAHDFNNYLLAIVAVSESIQAAADDDQVREDARQIESAALNAADVCKEMLTFTGKSQLRKEYVEPASLLAELEPLLRAAMPKNVELQFQIPQEALAVLVDPSQIKQAILNLVTNAAEATQPDGGVVDVRCYTFSSSKADSDSGALVVRGPLGPGEYIAFAVSDNGEGMDLNTQSQAFDPYFTTKTTGHGFGLSVTAGIVKGHGGAIRCSSQPGHGTTMTLVFPRVRRPLRVEPSADHAVATGLGWILVVDDEPLVLTSVARMLESVGWSVAQASDGARAIELLTQSAQPFMAVVMDYAMPGMNGLRVVEQMRAAQIDTPVVLCSGFMDPSHDEAPRVAAEAFIKKPYRLDALQSAIATALLGKRVPPLERAEG